MHAFVHPSLILTHTPSVGYTVALPHPRPGLLFGPLFPLGTLCGATCGAVEAAEEQGMHASKCSSLSCSLLLPLHSLPSLLFQFPYYSTTIPSLTLTLTLTSILPHSTTPQEPGLRRIEGRLRAEQAAHVRAVCGDSGRKGAQRRAGDRGAPRVHRRAVQCTHGFTLA
jgi:hypothetical protein